jgi:hypothetical protein
MTGATNHLKMLGLVPVAAAALTAIAGIGTASATVLCEEWEKPCPKAAVYEAGTQIEATLESGTTSVFRQTGGTVLSTCTGSTIKGKTTNAGGESEPVTGTIETMTFTGCTTVFTVIAAGAFEIKYLGPETLGSLTGKGTELTVTILGVSCTYGTGAFTYMGKMTSSEVQLTPTIDLQALLAKRAGSFLCPGDVTWEASYTVTKPDPLFFKLKSA